MHPLYALLANRPHLVAEHAQAYGELLVAEVGRVSAGLKRAALLNAAALAGLAVAVVLAGVALMLWSVLPAMAAGSAWVLLAVPLVPALAALGCLLALRDSGQQQVLATLREQLQADLTMLREVAST